MMHQKVGVAMSGGVDSSVAASLLKQKNFVVEGFFMRLPLPGAEEHVLRVRTIADHLDIPLHCIDLQESFSRTVIDYFITTYRSGHTPNPCIICNRQIKFGKLLDIMKHKGMQKIATGHYARVKKINDREFVVRSGRDPVKDQSYFLCRLASDQLKNTLLPLGDLTKEQVYGLASRLGLSTIHGPESQDICFLSGRTVSDFFARRGMADSPGDITDSGGRVIGQHRGLWHYTIGQRRGLGLPDATPWYVQQLDAANNRLVVCKNESLYTGEIVVRDVWWAATAGSIPWRGKVRIRGRHKAAAATIAPGKAGEWIITFATSQRAATPGQFAAFYKDDCVVGSGIITGPGTAGKTMP